MPLVIFLSMEWICNICFNIFVYSSTVYVSPGSISIDWFLSLWIISSSCVKCLVILDWMPDIWIYLVGCWIYWHFYISFWILFWSVIISPWNSLVHWCVAIKIRQYQTSACFTANASPPLRHDLLDTQFPIIMRFSFCFPGTSTIPGPAWAPGTVFTAPFGWFFPSYW